MDLWEKWQKHYEARGLAINEICKDGIINEDEYKVANPRLLFVMKEVNDWPGGNLKELFANGPKYPMWHTIAKWTTGILEGFLPFGDINRWERYSKNIFKIASINLKKSSGGASSDMSLINAYAHQDRELLIEQISTINPNLIIACGTFEQLVWLLDLNIDCKNHSQPILAEMGTIKAWAIPFRHPARVTDQEGCYLKLKELCRVCPTK